MKTQRNSSVDVFVGFPKFRSFKSKLGTTNKCIIAYKVGNYLIFAFVLGILSKVNPLSASTTKFTAELFEWVWPFCGVGA